MRQIDWVLVVMCLMSWTITAFSVHFAFYQCREARRLTNLLIARFQPTLQEAEATRTGEAPSASASVRFPEQLA